MAEEKLKGKFLYTPELAQQDVVMRRPFCWWWLLLLLLLLPLFIRCDRTVTVHVVDEAGRPVAGADVELSYTAHYLWNDGPFTSIPEFRQGQTDRAGELELEELPCSVFSYIFYTAAKGHAEASAPDYEPGEADFAFHWRRHVTVVLKAKPIDVQVRVLDKLTGEPVPDAEVAVTRDGSGLGTFPVDNQGVATIPGLKPGDKLNLVGRAPGYETNDSTLRAVTADELRSANPPKAIPLQPVFNCDDDVQYQSQYQPVVNIEHIDMHKNSGTFTLGATTFSFPDRIVVTDAEGRQLLDTGYFATPGDSEEDRSFPGIRFNTRYINITIYSDPQNPTNSAWVVKPHCPD